MEDDTPPPVRTLTVREAADALRVATSHLYELIREDRLPGVIRVGASIRLLEDTFVAWVLAGGHKPTDDPQQQTDHERDALGETD